MEKPAIIRALEADPRMVDYAGMAMYKIREPKGSQRLTFQQISIGKQRRNRELAVTVITQVLERFPDPQAVQSVDEVKDYMADVMYRTLAPSKAEHFPLDQRTPFARSYYREKASGFFYDFLEPLARQSKSQLTTSQGASLGAGSSKPLPLSGKTKSVGKGKQPRVQSNVDAKSTKRTVALAPGESKAAKRRESSGARNDVKRGSQEDGTSSRIAAELAAKREGHRQTSHEPIHRDASFGNSTRSPRSQKDAPVPSLSTESHSAFIGCLLLLILIVLVALLIRTF